MPSANPQQIPLLHLLESVLSSSFSPVSRRRLSPSGRLVIRYTPQHPFSLLSTTTLHTSLQDRPLQRNFPHRRSLTSVCFSAYLEAWPVPIDLKATRCSQAASIPSAFDKKYADPRDTAKMSTIQQLKNFIRHGMSPPMTSILRLECVLRRGGRKTWRLPLPRHHQRNQRLTILPPPRKTSQSRQRRFDALKA